MSHTFIEPARKTYGLSHNNFGRIVRPALPLAVFLAAIISHQKAAQSANDSPLGSKNKDQFNSVLKISLSDGNLLAESMVPYTGGERQITCDFAKMASLSVDCGYRNSLKITLYTPQDIGREYVSISTDSTKDRFFFLHKYPDGLKVSLDQNPGYYDEPAVKFSVKYSRNDKDGNDSEHTVLDVKVKDISELVARYPEMCSIFLQPTLERVGQPKLLIPSDTEIASLFEKFLLPDTSIEKRVNDLVRKLDDADFATRAQAVEDLQASDAKCLLFLSKMDLKAVSVNQRSDIRVALKNVRTFDEKTAEKWRNDVPLLVNCLNTENTQLWDLSYLRLKAITSDEEVKKILMDTNKRDLVNVLREKIKRQILARPIE